MTRLGQLGCGLVLAGATTLGSAVDANAAPMLTMLEHDRSDFMSEKVAGVDGFDDFNPDNIGLQEQFGVFDSPSRSNPFAVDPLGSDGFAAPLGRGGQAGFSNDGVKGDGRLSPVAKQIPEPTTLLLTGLGLVGLAASRRRRV
jgi:hypothetical protein